MNSSPIYKPVLTLLFILGLIALLYIARPFLVPIGYAMLFSIAMTPLAIRLERRHVPRGLSIFICVTVLLLVILGTISLLSVRTVGIAQDFGTLQDKMFQKIDHAENYIEDVTHWSQARQIAYLKSQTSMILGAVSTYTKSLLTTTTVTMVEFGLVLFYICCFMYYRERFHQFMLQVLPKSQRSAAHQVTNKISDMTYQYLSGRLLVMLIQAVLYYIGFLIVGCPYPLFFAVLGALFNIIPYIGAVLAGLFPLVMALLISSISTVIGVAATAIIVHLVESNLLTPKIVGAKVKINPLFTVFTVVIGELIWGIAGMILFIPLLGVVKIICDSVDSLTPYGRLIGDEPMHIKEEEEVEIEVVA